MASKTALLLCLLAGARAVMVRDSSPPLAAEDRELVHDLAHAVADGIKAADGFIADVVDEVTEGFAEEAEEDGDMHQMSVDDDEGEGDGEMHKTSDDGQAAEEAEEAAEEAEEDGGMRQKSTDEEEEEEDEGDGEMHKTDAGSAVNDDSQEVTAGASSKLLAVEDRELIDGLANIVAAGVRAADTLLEEFESGLKEGSELARQAEEDEGED